MLQHVSECPSFIRLYNIPLYSVYIYIYVYTHTIHTHTVYISYLVIHSSSNGHLDCFCLLAIVNNTVTHVGVQISVQVSALISFGYIPDMKLLNHMIILLFFEEMPYCFS